MTLFVIKLVSEVYEFVISDRIGHTLFNIYLSKMIPPTNAELPPRSGLYNGFKISQNINWSKILSLIRFSHPNIKCILRHNGIKCHT